MNYQLEIQQWEMAWDFGDIIILNEVFWFFDELQASFRIQDY